MSYRQEQLEWLIDLEKQRAERAEAECMRLWERIDRNEKEIRELRREKGK